MSGPSLKIIALSIALLLLGVEIGAAIVGQIMVPSKTALPTTVTVTSYSTVESTLTITKKIAKTSTITFTLIQTVNVDSDNDGLTDYLESQLGTDPTSKDSDHDGLSDMEELIFYGTDPLSKDSDGDGISDAGEVKYKTNPNLADSDGDGIDDYQEIFSYHTDPLRPNPSLAYALKIKLDPSLFNYTKILDQDGIVDENEKKLMDTLVYISSELVPDDLREYYIDVRPLSEKWGDGEYRRYYEQHWSELLDTQRNLLSSVLSDGRVSDLEVEVMEKLRHERWYVAKDIMDSGMISDENLNQDWDKDGISNIDEINQGTNPLNDLEIDAKDLSERYAVLVAAYGAVGVARSILAVYHLLKRAGYKDENIQLFIYIHPAHRTPEYLEWLDSVPELLNFSFFVWLKNPPLSGYQVEIDYLNEEVTPSNFVKSLRNLPSDDNDIVFIYYYGHGPGPLGHLGLVYPKDMNEVLSSLHFGRLIFLNDACSSESYIKVLNKPYQLKNVLAMATLGEGEEAGPVFDDYLFQYVDMKLSLKDACEKAIEKSIEYGQHPTVYYFDPQNAECPWCDNFSIIKYLKES